jgi:uncharacterized protein (DUF1501 family)
MNRRFFIKSGGVALASIGISLSAPSFLERVALGQTRERVIGGRRKTLVAIFQRGAVDGLNMVVPFGESSYYDLRPSIAIPKPDSANAEAAVNLDGFFAHPSRSSFKPLGIETIGHRPLPAQRTTPDRTSMHRTMESATPMSSRPTMVGSIVIFRLNPGRTSLCFVPSHSHKQCRVLQGRAPAIAVANLADFTIRAGRSSANLQSGFEEIYAQNTSDSLAGMGRETFEAVNYLKRVNPAQYKPENGAQYPRNPFGNSLLQIAQLIKAGVGFKVAFTDIGGWDTHVNEGNSRGIATFYSSLVPASRRSIRIWANTWTT